MRLKYTTLSVAVALALLGNSVNLYADNDFPPGGGEPMMGPGGDEPMGPDGGDPMMGPGGDEPMGPDGDDPMMGPGGDEPMGPDGGDPMMGPGGDEPMGPDGDDPMMGPDGGDPMMEPGDGEPMRPDGGDPVMGPGDGEPMRPDGGDPIMGPGDGEPMGPDGGDPVMGPGGDEPMGPDGGDPVMGPGGDEPMGPGGDEPMGPGGDEPMRPDGDDPMMGPDSGEPMGPDGDDPMMGPGDGEPMRPDGGDPMMGPDNPDYMDIEHGIPPEEFIPYVPEYRVDDFYNPREMTSFGHFPERFETEDGQELSGDQIFLSFDEDDMEEIPPEAFGDIKAEQLTKFDDRALGGIRPEQFRQMPPDIMGQMPPEKIGKFEPDVYEEFGETHLEQLRQNKEEFHKVPPEDLGRIFCNLPDNVGYEEVQDLIPENFEVDPETLEFMPPEGTHLSWDQWDLPAEFPQDEIELPDEMPNFQKAFGLGGRGDRGAFDDFNEILQENQLGDFQFEQAEGDFVLRVKGPVEFAFQADTANMKQAAKDAKPGLGTDDEGNYVMTTKDGRQVPVLPAPKSNPSLLKLLKLDEEGEETNTRAGNVGVRRIQYNERGVTVLNTRMRRQDDSNSFEDMANAEEIMGEEIVRRRSPEAVLFDPAIKPNIPKDSGGTLRQPGVYMARDKSEGEVVYEDGTAQTVRAAISSPSKFLQAARRFNGVTSAKRRADGSFDVEIAMSAPDGKEAKQTLRLRPIFGSKVKPLKAKEKTPDPAIGLSADGMVEFSTPEDGSDGKAEVRIMRLRIELQ